MSINIKSQNIFPNVHFNIYTTAPSLLLSVQYLYIKSSSPLSPLSQPSNQT